MPARSTKEVPAQTAAVDKTKPAQTTPVETTKAAAVQTTAKETTEETAKETTVAEPAVPTTHVHNFGSWIVTEQPTCTAAGKRTRTCICGETESEDVAALGHSFSSWTVVSEPTCTLSGRQERTCERCGKIEKQSIPILGHDIVDGVCTRCGESEFTFILNGDGKSYMITGAGRLDVSKKVVMPSSYKGLPVTQIRKSAFKDYDFANGLELPSALTSIEQSTFARARIKGTLVIPGSVKTIGQSAFSGASLDTVIMEEGVVTLKELAFAAQQGRPSITIPSSLREGEAAFTLGGVEGVTHLGTLTVNSKTFLDNLNTFGYVLIDTIKVGANVSGYSVRGNCLIRNSTGTILKAGVNFTIPTDGSIKVIDGLAFFTDFNGSPSGSTLYELRIPEGVVKIGNAAYSSVIQTIYLPHSLKDIGPNSFWGGCPKSYVYAGTMAEWITLTANPETPENDRWRERPTLLIYCSDGTLRYDTDHWAQQ